MHKTMIWERAREVQRLRHQLREYFPAALEAFDDLDAPEVLELLGRAPEPARAARLTRAQVSAALKRAGRRNITERATVILAALRGEQLGQPEARDGKARRNYAATSPVTRASGKKKVVAARYVHNDRLVDALNAQAFSALTVSPGARAFYDQQRASGHDCNDALRRLANRLAGIHRGCLKTRTLYDEDTAWGHRQQTRQAA